MQNPYGGGGNQYGQPNPLISNAFGLMQNPDVRQMGVNYLQKEFEER